MISKAETNSIQKIARAVGVLFFAGMVIGIAGNILIQSIVATAEPLVKVTANSPLLALGAVLMLLTGSWDAAHGVLMFPVLKRHSAGMAAGYLAFRIVDAVFMAVSVLFVLLQIPLASEFVKAGAAIRPGLQALGTLSMQANLYAYNIAMTFLGIAGLILCYMLLRTKLVPRVVAVWGLVGYAVILGGSVLELLGFGLNSLHTLPGGLWELFIGVWLIVKGFNSAAIVPRATRSGNPAQPLVPQLDPAI
jgi:Domain of unknown function (DUF4386)